MMRRIAVLLVCLIGLLVNDSSAKAVPAAAPQYMQNGRLILMDTDGSNVRTIAQYATRFAWSARGDQMLYVEHKCRTGSCYENLIVINADGSKPKTILRVAPGKSILGIAWSPDGKTLALWADLLTSSLDLYLMASNGSNLRRFSALFNNLVSGSRTAEGLQWSPDGKKIAFSSLFAGEAKWQVVVANSDGTKPQRLSGGWKNQMYPRWSPDGKQIVFNEYYDRLWETGSSIVAVNADGTGSRTLVDNEQDQTVNCDVIWSPDGKQIGFSSNRDYMSLPSQDRRLDVYVVDVDGTHMQRLTNISNLPSVITARYMSWSPDGKTIAYLQVSTEQIPN